MRRIALWIGGLVLVGCTAASSPAGSELSPAVTRRPRCRWPGVGLALLAAGSLVGCVATPSLSTPVPSASAGSISGELPPGCEPIDLRGPDGGPIDLTGAWSGPPDSAGFYQSTNETTWIRQVGDCLWAAIMDAEFRSDPNYVGDFDLPAGNLGTFSGRITSDFVVEGDLVSIRHGSPLAPTTFVPIRMLIEFDSDGEIVLREDRDPSDLSPRCYGMPGSDPFCPTEVILYRVDDL
jgi:hypothetical protein